MSDTEPMVWFAMRATYGRNLEAKKMLDETGVESYIPMHHVISLGKGGRKVKKYVPVVRDLVFVRTTKEGMLSIKESLDYLRNIYIPTAEGKKQIVVVPDQQMDSFMMVAGAQNEGIMYFSPDEINVAKGTKVRIHGGPYDGLEGSFLKVKGVREKRVVVEISGVIVVATATLSCDLVEVLANEESK